MAAIIAGLWERRQLACWLTLDTIYLNVLLINGLELLRTSMDTMLFLWLDPGYQTGISINHKKRRRIHLLPRSTGQSLSKRTHNGQDSLKTDSSSSSPSPSRSNTSQIITSSISVGRSPVSLGTAVQLLSFRGLHQLFCSPLFWRARFFLLNKQPNAFVYGPSKIPIALSVARARD